MDLGVVSDVHAQSFGEPGQRTFRLLTEIDDGSMSLWLEKEQVVMMGSAMEEILSRVPPPLGDGPVPSGPPTFRGEMEVRVGSLSIGYDLEHTAFSIEAGDLESSLGLDSVVLFAGRDVLAHLVEEISDIVAAGRPRCPLCGTPLSSEPHFCPRSNGHAHVEGRTE
ncbi:MAG: DUF3090 family protein [Chloroflexota bacterium]